MPFDTIVNALIYSFITLAMFCVGLAVQWADILTAVSDRSKTARALLANIVMAPLVALILVAVLPLPPATAIVLLLLGFAPGGINAIQFSTKSKGYLASAAGLLFLLSLISVVTAPVAANFIIGNENALALPYAQIALRTLVLILLPLIAGMAIRRATPDLAERLYKPAMLISTLSFIASVMLSMGVRQDALGELGNVTFVAMLTFILVLMAAGWILGGPEPGHRQVLAVCTNLRNVGLVYVIVDGCCADPQLTTAVFAFMALMVPPNLVLTLFMAYRRKKHLA